MSALSMSAKDDTRVSENRRSRSNGPRSRSRHRLPLAVVLSASLTLLCADAFTPLSSRIHISVQRRAAFPEIEAEKRRHHEAGSQLLYKEYTDEPQPQAFRDERRRGGSDFQRRMREAALGKRRPTKQAGARRPKKQRPFNVKLVETLEDYKANVADERERLVVVRFFAPWCRACKAMAPYFYRMAEANPSLSFVEVPVSAKSAALHQGLGVPSIPFGHVYHPTAGLVEETKINRKVFSKFEERVQSYVDEYCEIPSDGDCSNPYIKQVLDGGDV